MDSIPYIPFYMIYSALSFNDKGRFRLAFPNSYNLSLLPRKEPQKIYCVLCQLEHLCNFLEQEWGPVSNSLPQYLSPTQRNIFRTFTKFFLQTLGTHESFTNVTDLERHILEDHINFYILSIHIDDLPEVVNKHHMTNSVPLLKALAYTLKIFRNLHSYHESWPRPSHEHIHYDLFVCLYIFIQKLVKEEKDVPSDERRYTNFFYHFSTNFLIMRLAQYIVCNDKNSKVINYHRSTTIHSIFGHDNVMPWIPLHRIPELVCWNPETKRFILRGQN